MKVVVLDGYTLNPGDLSWKELEELGDVAIYDRTSPCDVIARSLGAEVILTNKVVLTSAVLKELSSTLRYVGVLATGYNVVDINAASDLGIVVTNIPAYSTMSVVQHVFALLLNVTNRVAHYSHQILCDDAWTRSSDFSYTDTSLMELYGKVMGIVGLGRIGSAVAKVANALGMSVIAFTSKEASELPPYIQKVSMRELFAHSDVLSLHCPLTEETKNLVSAEKLQWMKPSAIIINTGRGPLIDERAVAQALISDRLGAFAADVLSKEPPSSDNPLLSAPRVYLTPHIAWATFEARTRLMQICVGNIKSFLAGNPVNVVNRL